jgi:hypothetical protein
LDWPEEQVRVIGMLVVVVLEKGGHCWTNSCRLVFEPLDGL